SDAFVVRQLEHEEVHEQQAEQRGVGVEHLDGGAAERASGHARAFASDGAAPARTSQLILHALLAPKSERCSWFCWASTDALNGPGETPCHITSGATPGPMIVARSFVPAEERPPCG